MRKLFSDAIICANQPNTEIPGTDFIPNATFIGKVSSRAASKNDVGVIYAPIVNGLIAMLSGRVSAAFTNGNDNVDNPVIYVEIENENGEICAILYDSDTNTYKYEWQGSPIEIVGAPTSKMPIGMYPIIPRLVELLYNGVPEFVEYYEVIRDEFFKKPLIQCKELVKICDLLYRHSLIGDGQIDKGGFDIDLDDFEKVENINLEANYEGKPIDLTLDISECMGHSGNFTKLIFANTTVSRSVNGNTNGMHLASPGEIPMEFMTPAYFPKMPSNIVLRPEMVEVAQYIYISKDDEQPINNITLFGPTGSGKSFMCKYWASESCFSVPYIAVACSGNKDESMFTGMYQNGEKGKTIYVNSKFAKYIQMPCVIEMVESNSLDEDAMLILNAFKDKDYGYLITDDFQMIKRHPKCIVVDTFNPGYAGTKTPNRSVIRRSDLAIRIDKVSADEIKSMISATSGVTDENILNLTYEVFEIIENYITTNDLDGEVSMAEYGMCAKFLSLDKRLNRWNPITVIRNSVINKLISTIDFDREIGEEIENLLKPVVNIW